MTTALQIIEDALEDLEVKSAEVALTDAEVNSGIRRMNRIMTELAAVGHQIGFTKIAKSSDRLTIPDWAEAMLVSQLAVTLASSYGVVATQFLIDNANSSMTMFRNRMVTLGPTLLPDTLPVGIGNGTHDYHRKFFTNTTDDDLTTHKDALTGNAGDIIEVNG